MCSSRAAVLILAESKSPASRLHNQFPEVGERFARALRHCANILCYTCTGFDRSNCKNTFAVEVIGGERALTAPGRQNEGEGANVRASKGGSRAEIDGSHEEQLKRGVLGAKRDGNRWKTPL